MSHESDNKIYSLKLTFAALTTFINHPQSCINKNKEAVDTSQGRARRRRDDTGDDNTAHDNTAGAIRESACDAREDSCVRTENKRSKNTNISTCGTRHRERTEKSREENAIAPRRGETYEDPSELETEARLAATSCERWNDVGPERLRRAPPPPPDSTTHTHMTLHAHTPRPRPPGVGNQANTISGHTYGSYS